MRAPLLPALPPHSHAHAPCRSLQASAAVSIAALVRKRRALTCLKPPRPYLPLVAAACLQEGELARLLLELGAAGKRAALAEVRVV